LKSLTDTHDTKRQNQIFKVYKRKWPIQKNTDQRKQKSPKRNESDSKASHMSGKKWHPQARQFITNWTSPQMDAYLAIPEVALEWIVDPG
jgi:hypothetical protein